MLLNAGENTVVNQDKAVPVQSNTAQRHDNVPLEETSSNRIGFSSSYPIKTVILPA